MRTVLDRVVSLQAIIQLSFLSNFLCWDKNEENLLLIFISKKPMRQKSGGTHRFSVEQDLWFWASMDSTVTKKNGWKNSRTLVLLMKLKEELHASHTEFLENRRDYESSTTTVLSAYRCRCRQHRPLDFLFLASRIMVSKNVWRTKKP